MNDDNIKERRTIIWRRLRKTGTIVGSLSIMFFLGIGWVMIGMTFFCSGAALLEFIGSIPCIIFNLKNGIGATLIAIGCGLIALSLVWPIWIVAMEFFKGYKMVNDAIIGWLKQIAQK